MIVYIDRLSGDEMLSDAYKLLPVVDSDGETVEGLQMCVSKMVQEAGDDVDVGCGNAFGGEAEEAGASDAVMVNNVVKGFSYTETQMSSATELKAWLKEYMMAVRTKLREANTPKEEIQAFMGCASGIAKFLIKNFSDVQFYLGPSFSPESMVFSIYPEGAVTPNFYFIMAGFKAEKY